MHFLSCTEGATPFVAGGGSHRGQNALKSARKGRPIELNRCLFSRRSIEMN